MCIFRYRRLGASISVLRTKDIEGVDEIKKVAEVLVRKVPENQQVIQGKHHKSELCAYCDFLLSS